jgi:hypothetical protein
MRSYGRESLVYTAVFCLGYLVACGSGGGTGGSSSGGNTAGSIRQMVSSDLRPVSIVQGSTVVQSAMAAFLPSMGKARPALTIANPSAVGQSYESDCHNFGPVSGPFTSIHAAWGNTGLISINTPMPHSGRASKHSRSPRWVATRTVTRRAIQSSSMEPATRSRFTVPLPVARDSNVWTPQTHRPFPMARLCVPTMIWRTTQSFWAVGQPSLHPLVVSPSLRATTCLKYTCSGSRTKAAMGRPSSFAAPSLLNHRTTLTTRLAQ